MCEIAVVDPEVCDPAIIHQIAAKFEDEQGDGLGVLAVKNADDSFEYSTYKSVHPHWQTLYSFIKRNMEDTWRFVIHGRALTSGAVNRESAHPISIDCDHCEFDYVIHNGSVRNYSNIRKSLKSSGHHFNTGVDTEIIPHRIGELPDTVEDHSQQTYTFRGNLNYLVFSEDGILVRVSSKYHLTDDFTMTCSMPFFGDHAESLGFEEGTDNEWMLITPTDGAPDIETKERATFPNTSSRHGRSYRSGVGWGGYVNNGNNSSQSGASTDDSDDERVHTKEYVDHSPFEDVLAFQVAPGVMELINERDDDVVYIFRDENPRLYFWYSDDPTPDNIEQLERLAGREPEEAEQCSIAEFEDEGNGDPDDDVVDKEVEDTVANVLAAEAGNVSVEEAAEIAEDVQKVIDEDAQQTQETIGA